jgi:hypothetical protein
MRNKLQDIETAVLWSALIEIGKLFNQSREKKEQNKALFYSKMMREIIWEIDRRLDIEYVN